MTSDVFFWVGVAGRVECASYCPSPEAYWPHRLLAASDCRSLLLTWALGVKRRWLESWPRFPHQYVAPSAVRCERPWSHKRLRKVCNLGLHRYHSLSLGGLRVSGLGGGETQNELKPSRVSRFSAPPPNPRDVWPLHVIRGAPDGATGNQLR